MDPWHSIWLPSYGGFLKLWYPTTMGFPTKNDHFGVFWGYHHLRKHPYIYIYTQWFNDNQRFRTHEHIDEVTSIFTLIPKEVTTHTGYLTPQAIFLANHEQIPVHSLCIPKVCWTNLTFIWGNFSYIILKPLNLRVIFFWEDSIKLNPTIFGAFLQQTFCERFGDRSMQFVPSD